MRYLKYRNSSIPPGQKLLSITYSWNGVAMNEENVTYLGRDGKRLVFSTNKQEGDLIVVTRKRLLELLK